MSDKMKILTLSSLVLLLAPLIFLGGQPVEIGTVSWSRDYDSSLKEAKKQNKPLFVLFQEVPGCKACKDYGKTVLSHPLLVEAIEDEFIPVLVHNNKSGIDETLLKKFNEIAWNYQVVRFIDSKEQDIIPREEKVWSREETAQRMAMALTEYGKTVPNYLSFVKQEFNDADLEEALFSMFCFWTGEVKLGGIDGVVKTEVGFYQGREVVKVWYDKQHITLNGLVTESAKIKCANRVYTNVTGKYALPRENYKASEYTKAPPSDQKKQINGTQFKRLNLSDFQKTKINAFVRTNLEKAKTYLSPRQSRNLLN